MTTMVLKRRKSRVSYRFASGFPEFTSNRREFLISTWALAAVQALLFIALFVGAWQGYATMRVGFPHLGWQLRIGIPIVTCFVALIVLRLCIVSVRRALAVQRTPPKPPPSGGTSPPSE
jgi:uncharacterized integral membrane protein